MAEAEQVRSKLGKTYPKSEVVAMQPTYIAELRQLSKNKCCAECGARDVSWCTLKSARFVCVNCAQKLRADAANKLKACSGTSYLWFDDEMQLMREANK
ncbi:hypothetical protein FVE85_4891 [Porphyridium purpureum]|uniref:Arf-GAP domain-containing protein n=1 Tax=Porphyridium purpureum TaxID=35688 RepID=A0A5J4YSQ7_PORPP|nr:hypothetical protein FVE85_4891 [Porphyridium purpureum]|eukprot:POR5353..scf236_6